MDLTPRRSMGDVARVLRWAYSAGRLGAECGTECLCRLRAAGDCLGWYHGRLSSAPIPVPVPAAATTSKPKKKGKKLKRLLILILLASAGAGIAWQQGLI